MGDKKSSVQWQTMPGKEGVLYREHQTRKHGRGPDRCLSIRYRKGDGKRAHESLGWTSEGWTVAMAVSILRELKENIRLGKRPQSLREKRTMAEEAKIEAEKLAAKAKLATISFGELAEIYREWCKAHRASAKHVAQMLDMHILPEIGCRAAIDITPADIAALGKIVAQKRPLSGRNKNVEGATLSPQTVLHVLKTVREVYNFALETPAPESPGTMLFSGVNPALLTRRNRALTLPKVDARRLRVLNDTEVTDLLNYRGHRAEFAEIHDMLLFALDTGVRAGELVTLRREACDPVNGTIRVLTGAADSERSTKGGSTRIVRAGRLFPECLEMLRNRISTGGGTGYLFPTEGGAARNAKSLSRIMARIMTKLGWNTDVSDARNRIVWHTLRHTFATRMLEAGTDIYALKVLMGHASVTTTEIYLHICDMDKRRMALAKAEIARQTGVTESEGQ